MSARTSPQWPTYLLGLLCLGAIATAVLIVGPASGSPAGAGRTITVTRGVVQSTVSGAGNIQAATQLDLGFKTSGVVARIYATPGEHVTQGHLLYVSNAEGNTVKIVTSPASSITKTVITDVRGIHPGDTVVVRGPKGAGGAVSAESVTVGSGASAGIGGGGLGSLFGGGPRSGG